MNIEKIYKFLADYPKFRVKQAKKALFSELLSDWSNFSNFPLDLRQKLNEECPLDIDGQIFCSEDGKTVKALIDFEDVKIETVLMDHGARYTICVSSQAGCPLGCKFCATGQMGFKRNLTASEIVSQVIFFLRYIKDNDKEDKQVNVVFMGMGEPFLNYDNVLKAIRLLNDQEGLSLGARHMSVSTSGIVDGIKKLATENLQVNLAISLHASNETLRSKLMPINKKYPLKKVLAAAEDFIAKTNKQVMLEYVMIDGVNDSDFCANELIDLLKNPLFMVNLIPYNATGLPAQAGDFKASPPERVKHFMNILLRKGIHVRQRYRFGNGIKAACGQLATDID